MIRYQAVGQLVALSCVAQAVGGSAVSLARAQAVALRHGDRVGLVVARYKTLIESSPRKLCPECGGIGLCTYPDVTPSPLPCVTCDDGSLWGRGRGWIDPTTT